MADSTSDYLDGMVDTALALEALAGRTLPYSLRLPLALGDCDVAVNYYASNGVTGVRVPWPHYVGTYADGYDDAVRALLRALRRRLLGPHNPDAVVVGTYWRAARAFLPEAYLAACASEQIDGRLFCSARGGASINYQSVTLQIPDTSLYMSHLDADIACALADNLLARAE